MADIHSDWMVIGFNDTHFNQYYTQEVLGLGIVIKAITIKELVDSVPADN